VGRNLGQERGEKHLVGFMEFSPITKDWLGRPDNGTWTWGRGSTTSRDKREPRKKEQGQKNSYKDCPEELSRFNVCPKET